MSYRIYCYTHIESGKKYVGYTGQSKEKRLNGHSKSNYYFSNALNKYGIDSFIYEELEINIEKIQEACAREVHFIAKLNSLWPDGFNLNPGGNGNHNEKGSFKLSEETNKAKSIAMKGIVWSPERNANISKFRTGIKRGSMSEEQKTKISSSLKYNFKASHREAIIKSNKIRASKPNKRKLEMEEMMANVRRLNAK